MRKTIIKIIACVFTFFISIAVISAISNQGNADMTVEMSPAAFPLVYVTKSGQEINCMHGYSDEMTESYMRDTITPIGNDRKIDLHIDTYNSKIASLGFEVRSIDGSRLIENTQVSDAKTVEDGIDVQIVLKDLIEPENEYNLTFLITGENGEIIRYYTRIIQSEELHLDEKLQFVTMFHQSTFSKDKSIAKYLEPNSDGDNTTFNKVDIHSSFSQITWGNLDITKTDEVQTTITEIGTQTASIVLDYTVMLGEVKYRIQELYRVKYGTERMYLLNYKRTMNQYPEMSQNIFTSSKISLGISNPDLEKRESEDGNIIAFVQENTLYSFNMVDNKYTRLFSFYDGENWDTRTLYNNHGIKILTLEETGNVRFMEYGYMNRGRHEGSVGIQIYYFNSMTNTIEEDIYFHYNKSYDLLEKEIDNLAYVSKDNQLYLMINGTVHAIDLVDKKSEIVATGLKEDSYKVSEDNKMIVWQTETNKINNQELILLNLNTKEENRTKVTENERIAPIGFMGDDVIYGIAETASIVTDTSGETLFPMSQIIIQNEIGDILKKYEQDGIYVTEGFVEDNLLTLKRITDQFVEGGAQPEDQSQTEEAAQQEDEPLQEENLQTESGVFYQEIEDDQILNSKIAESTQNNLEVVQTQELEAIVQVVLKKTVTPDTIKFMMPKEVLFEGGREVVLSDQEEMYPRYYVYNEDAIDSIWTDSAKAVKRASEIAGVVQNDGGDDIWEYGNRLTKNQIMKIKETAIGEGENSVSVCLDTILSFEGIQKKTLLQLTGGENVYSILEQNMEASQILILSGCSLESILYYVNRDIPVMAMLEDGNAVLVIGFNELNIVIFDPQIGTIYKKGMNDSKQWFEENGNNFIAYIKNN